MNANEAQDDMRTHGYTRRIHFEEKSLTDPTDIGCQGQKISLGVGAIEFTRERPGDLSTKNLFTSVFLNRVYFSPTNNLFYAMVATTIPSIHHAARFGSTVQAWAAISPQDMKNTLCTNVGSVPPSSPGHPIRRTLSLFIKNLTPPTL